MNQELNIDTEGIKKALNQLMSHELNIETEGIKKALNQLTPIFNSISKSTFIDLEKDSPIHIKKLSEYGWFMNGGMSANFVWRAYSFLEDNEIGKADHLMTTYFKEDFEKIFRQLKNSFPNRIRIFDEIIRNFESQNYSAAIILTLSQVDGICHEKTNLKFFIKDKENYRPEVIKYFEGIEHYWYLELVLKAINHNTPLNVHEKDIDDFQIRFNRHEIMHGIDIDYGIEANFWKAVSLLRFMSELIRLKKKN